MKYSQAEKFEIIRLVEHSDLGVRRTLEHIGICKSSFYEWYHRYLEDGYDGLSSKSKRPNQFWNRIPDQERKKVVDYALDHTWLSCREVAVEFTDKHRYFISESSVYRILKAAGLITSPAYAIQTAANEYQHQTTRINELWQTDFTYFKIIGWGWYYLSTILDDYSRKILAWKLCTQMAAEEVTLTLNMAISVTGVKAEKIKRRPRLLSDNGSCYISGYLKDYLNVQEMSHSRGRPFHPQTQGKIERYHRSMKNILLLDNYYLPQELEAQITDWVDYYNNRRYHESLGNITPSDKYAGRENQIFKERRKVKERTIRLRRRLNGFTLKDTGTPIAAPVK
jgi:putative transposase